MVKKITDKGSTKVSRSKDTSAVKKRPGRPLKNNLLAGSSRSRSSRSSISISISSSSSSKESKNNSNTNASRLAKGDASTKAEKKVVIKAKMSMISDLPAPVIIERRGIDLLLKEKMHWSASGSLTVMKAVAKFKVLAHRAEEHLHENDIEGPKTQREKRRMNLNKVKEGKALLSQRLEFLGLQTIEMLGDGNCQFRSFSSELFGTQDHHLYVRSIAIKWMMFHKEDFSFFVGKILQTIPGLILFFFELCNCVLDIYNHERSTNMCYTCNHKIFLSLSLSLFPLQ